MKALSKSEIPQLAKKLTVDDIDFLVGHLAEKDNETRYHAFLLLQAASQEFPLVHRFWGVFEKMGSDNSFQRSIGLMLIAENVRWDQEGKFTETFDRYMSLCRDEKFVTARQAIKGLAKVAAATSAYNERINKSWQTIRSNAIQKTSRNS